MAAPKTRFWSARENVHQPKGLHLLVTGQVEVASLHKLPDLKKTDSRDPKVLALTLTIADDPDEPTGNAVVWRGANYHEVVTKNQYENVVIRWEGDAIAHIKVIDDVEMGAAMKKQCAAQNAAAAKTIKLKPAKKPAAKTAKAAPKKAAPKKAAAKKKAPKAVGGWAKKAKKKTAKKAKTSAKKAASKSSFKRFVKKLAKKFSSSKKKKKR